MSALPFRLDALRASHRLCAGRRRPGEGRPGVPELAIRGLTTMSVKVKTYKDLKHPP
jgi:hypothetical protein